MDGVMTVSQERASADRIGARLKFFRAAKGLTQEELAKAIACERTVIARCESGEKVPSIKVMTRIARVLDIPQHRFFLEPGEDKEEPLARIPDLLYGMPDQRRHEALVPIILALESHYRPGQRGYEICQDLRTLAGLPQLGEERGE
jgi:transcriptional regulator with XRE-family HTH domain